MAVGQVPAAAAQCRAAAEVSTKATGDAIFKPSGCMVCAGPTKISVTGLFDTRFGIEGNFEVRRCLQCGLEQLFPIPAPAQLKDLYERYYNFSGERGTVYTKIREWFFSSSLYRLWIRLDGDISFHSRSGSGRL